MEAGAEGRAVEVTLEPAELAAAPGELATTTVRVHNPGSAAGVHCRVAVTGPVGEWAWVNPASVEVAAGETASVRISIRLPPPPEPRAGRVAFTVEVRAGDGGGAPVSSAAVLDVRPVVNVTAAIGPATVLTVRNQGNVAVTAALEGEGASVTPPSLQLEPGATATAVVKARGRAGHEFRVHVRPSEGPPVTASGTVPGGGGGRAGGSGRGGRVRWPVVVPVAAVVLLVGVLLVARGGGDGESSPDASGSVPGTTSAQRAPDDPACPLRNHLAADFNGIKRGGVPIPAQWSFLEARPGGCQPVRFNPCEPIHYVTNAALAPAGALDDLAAAFAQLSQATGITFVNDGPTDEPALANRPAYQPGLYGQRWAPILIVWDHGRPNRLDSDNPGGGRATNITGVYVTGFLLLNVDAIGDTTTRRPLANGFGDGATWGRVMIHELGHILGLGHVGSPQEIMFNELGIQRGRAEYHVGDLAGLKVVGTEGGCLTPPPRPAR